MNRESLQQLCELRLRDAEALMAASQWDGAYYLLGNWVECALKACVAKQFQLHEVPDLKLVKDFYTHSLETLLRISGAKSALESRVNGDANFAINWSTVRDWSSEVRHDVGITEHVARGMHVAVTDQDAGILPWLKTQW